MNDVLMSQSLAQNMEASQMTRDPFQQAQNQFQSKGQNTSVLSSSPMTNPVAQAQAPDMNSVFAKAGIDQKGLAMNDMGRFQLINRLKDKFGPGYEQNEDAVSALSAFDDNLKFLGAGKQTNMNESLANADRTLSALFGGKN